MADAGTNTIPGAPENKTIERPALLAMPSSPMVSVVFCPPVTEAGLTESAFKLGALIAKNAVFVVDPVVPETTMPVLASTPVEKIVKFALVLPAGIRTEGAVVATELGFVESVTVTPPVGARPERVAVPVVLTPPITTFGFTLTEAICGGRTVIVFCMTKPEPVSYTHLTLPTSDLV